METTSRPGFLTRRFSRDDCFGLHLTFGLLLCAALLCVFFLIARTVQGPEPPGLDARFYEALRAHREASAWTCAMFAGVTDLGGEWWVSYLVVFVTGVLVGLRQWGLALAWVLVVAVGGWLNDEVKQVYERPRPAERAAQVHESTSSFPSGHSMGSMIAYGMLGYLALLALPARRWARRAVVAGLALLVLAIGFSRMYLSAHWLTDVLAGFTMGAAWLALWIAVVESARRRNGQRRAAVLLAEKQASLRS